MVKNIESQNEVPSPREVTDALELAIAGSAPFSLIEKLASSAGLLTALAEVPAHALKPVVEERATKAMRAFHTWKTRSAKNVAA